MFGHRVIKRLRKRREALLKVTLHDQLMKEYELVVMANQLAWGLRKAILGFAVAMMNQPPP